jgi:hypothetical protein
MMWQTIRIFNKSKSKAKKKVWSLFFLIFFSLVLRLRHHFIFSSPWSSLFLASPFPHSRRLLLIVLLLKDQVAPQPAPNGSKKINGPPLPVPPGAKLIHQGTYMNVGD